MCFVSFLFLCVDGLRHTTASWRRWRRRWRWRWRVRRTLLSTNDFWWLDSVFTFIHTSNKQKAPVKWASAQHLFLFLFRPFNTLAHVLLPTVNIQSVGCDLHTYLFSQWILLRYNSEAHRQHHSRLTSTERQSFYLNFVCLFTL